MSNWKRIEGKVVEWIRLDGAFRAGAQGITKSPGQEPRPWTIADMESESSATIEMPVNEATFVNRMTFQCLSDNRTRITQQLSLRGEVQTDILTGMKTFESTAPEGLPSWHQLSSLTKEPQVRADNTRSVSLSASVTEAVAPHASEYETTSTAIPRSKKVTQWRSPKLIRVCSDELCH